MLGAQIGWAVGGVAGQLLFPAKMPDQNGPRLGDLSVQTSGYGVAIPVVAGRAKIAGNVIWKTDLKETATTRRTGGKGGPTQKTTEYSYSMSWATGLCEWLIPPTSAEVLRIWLDEKLVYDTTGQSTVSQVPGLTWRFYSGSETQLPDALIEATMGAGEAPAHRGLAYIVFEDVPMATFGNRMPNVTVELVADSVRTFPQTNSQPPASPIFASSPGANAYQSDFSSNVAVDYARGRIYEGRRRTAGASLASDYLVRVYDLLTMQTLSEHNWRDVIQGLFAPDTVINDDGITPGILHVAEDGFLYAAGGGDYHSALVKIDPDRMVAVGSFGPLEGAGFILSLRRTDLSSPIHITSVQVDRVGDTPRTYIIVGCQQAAAMTFDAEDMSYVWGSLVTTGSPPAPNNALSISPQLRPMQLVPGQRRSPLEANPGQDLWWIRSVEAGSYTVTIQRIEYTSGLANLGADNAMGMKVYGFPEIDVNAQVDAPASRSVLQSVWHDQSDNTLVITLATAGSQLSGWTRFSTFKWSPDGVVWTITNHTLPQFHDARGDIRRVFGGRWGLGGNFLIQPRTGDTVVDAAGDDFNTLYWLDDQISVVGYRSGGQGHFEIARRRLDVIAPNALTVGAVVDAICQRAGLDAALINTAALTDSLRGYTLPRPVSARDAITPLAAAFQFDAVEQDDVLVFRKRGGAPVAAIGYADLVREAPDATVVEETRAQDQELPRAVTVRFADIERGWEQNAATWSRPISPTATVGSRVSASFDLPMPLTVGEGKTVAKRITVATWRERTRLMFSVGPRFARLVPTDVVTVGTRDGATIRCRVLSVQDGANWTRRIEAVTEDAAAYSLTATGDGGSDWAEPTIPVPYYVRLILPNLALVQDADAAGGALREYGFVGAYDEATYRPVEIYRSPDVVAWDRLGAVVRPAAWGVVTAAPGAPASPWIWDNTNTITVSLTSGEVDSATDLEVLNGANAAALIGGDGQAEIVQFSTATALGGGAYQLSRLLRGRRGTEDQSARRTAGDTFVLLEPAATFRFQAMTSEATATRYHRAPTIYQTVDSAQATVTKFARGRAEQPYAPAQVAGTRDGSDNLTITWVRRTRLGGEWLDGAGDVPVSEAAEGYEVDILDGVSVVRTITGLSAPTASYSAADQTTDFGAPQAAVSLRVYQTSAAIGRGIAAEATI